MTDDRSFEAFVLAEHGRLLRTALLISGNDADAADLVQTAFERLYPRWNRLAADQPLAYARRIIVNAHRDRWRRRHREQLTDQPPDQQTIDDTSASFSDHDALMQAMRELTLKERQAVVARFLYGLSERETADELGWRSGTVKSTTHRALTKLRASDQFEEAKGVAL